MCPIFLSRRSVPRIKHLLTLLKTALFVCLARWQRELNTVVHAWTQKNNESTSFYTVPKRAYNELNNAERC